MESAARSQLARPKVSKQSYRGNVKHLGRVPHHARKTSRVARLDGRNLAACVLHQHVTMASAAQRWISSLFQLSKSWCGVHNAGLLGKHFWFAKWSLPSEVANADASLMSSLLRSLSAR